ncbi:PREDICTED: C2 domain-containing protein At1g53590-like isoform X2 [Nelumbo nucifera]|uniref:C2 domain-containing protein At1g53590-like isoform X2 n=2 Tax=Nelumbo nucifera TaxID=4432 RepID=A0A1U7Z3J1_NELNU|nr:PREDICTED: C2 domain-containing protein At1g53590-like isoform X2 [Nelumbo nucifera]DAD37512.1 TPA_asm: hypothetical protein HUJ06_008153 [Nelumbo nucifera]
MAITDVSIIHHVAIVLTLLWTLSSFNICHPAVYFISLIYLYEVHEHYSMRLRKKLQFEERKQANQRRVLSDSETVRWLNHAIEKIWPICMEHIVSQKFLLPIIPWFLEKYKPWTAKKAVIQHLYMGRTAPMFTDIRVLRHSTDDDHLVLELGLNFLSADDMSAIIAVKLRNRLGFGMWTKLHMTSMHVEGKVLIGVKFLREWPFLGRLRLCFVEPPYFQMTVKPIFNHGVDVAELPGIAGWLDKLLAIAFQQTLVEPNMLVVDVEKFVSAPTDAWFSVRGKEAIAYAKVEIVEGADMKPSDLNGLSDPYVKGQLGPYRFQTKIQKKTLAPKWQEEFKIPICTWESPNVLILEVRDKDHLFDDNLGDCSINITDLRGGQRHDMWLPLQNIKTGRVHLAVTVLDANNEMEEILCKEESSTKREDMNLEPSVTAEESSDSTLILEQNPKVADKFEPIDIEGQKHTGVWVHHPGSDVSRTWEPRKGKGRQADTLIYGEGNLFIDSLQSGAGLSIDDDSSNDENLEGKKQNPLNKFRKSLQKIGSAFHRSPKTEDPVDIKETIPSQSVNSQAVNEKTTALMFIVDDNICTAAVQDPKAEGVNFSPEKNGPESPDKGNIKGMAKSILKHAGRSAHGLKHALSRKGSSKSKGDSLLASTEKGTSSPSTENPWVVDSSDGESVSSSKGFTQVVKGIPIDSPLINKHVTESPKSEEQNVQTSLYDSSKNMEEASRGVATQSNIVCTDVHGEGEPLGTKLTEEYLATEQQ